MEELIEINSGLDLQVNDEIEMEMLLQFLHNTGEMIFFRLVVANHQHHEEGQIVTNYQHSEEGKVSTSHFLI